MACKGCIGAGKAHLCVTVKKNPKMVWHNFTQDDMKNKSREGVTMGTTPNDLYDSPRNDTKPLNEINRMSSAYTTQVTGIPGVLNDCLVQGFDITNISNGYHTPSQNHDFFRDNYHELAYNTPPIPGHLISISPEPESNFYQPDPVLDHNSSASNLFEIKICIGDKPYRQLSVLKNDMGFFVVQRPGIFGPSLREWFNSFIPEGSSFYWLEVDPLWQNTVRNHLGPGYLVLTPI